MDDLATDSIDRSEQSDPDETFAAVLDRLGSWEPGSEHAATTAGHLRTYLKRQLNGDQSSVWERDIVERRRGSMAADVVVNGEIGIKLVGKTGSPGPGDLSVTLLLLSERYNYLAIYWLDASPAGADHRRSLERRISAHQSDIKGLQFVGQSHDESDPTEADTSGVGLRHLLGAWLVGVLVVAVFWVVAWLITRTSGLARLFLLGVAGLFGLALVLGVFITH